MSSLDIYFIYVLKGSYIVMEIGALGFLVLLLIVGWVTEETKIGSYFINWFSKRFFNIDLETMED